MYKYILVFLCVIYFGCKKTELTPENSNSNPDSSSVDLKLPKLITNNVSNLTYFSVVFSGKILDSTGAKITQFGFVIDTVSRPTTVTNSYNFLVKNLNSDGTFSVNVTYLPSNVKFYIRAYAITSNGTGYGNEVTFTTLYQKTFVGDVNLSTQQQVIDFGANHYVVIDGGLNISGSASDLTPLLGLTIINNGFNTTGSLLKNFKGLDSLEITGAIFPNDFWVERNNNLVDFTGLGKLKYSRGSVQIDNNNSLLSVDGLDSYVAASAGSMRIGECEKLKNLNGLKNMTFVGDDFYIINNPSLTDITGLSKLSFLYGRLYIMNNSALQSLTGLESIQSLPGGIEIDNNLVLHDLSGLQNLNSIDGSVSIGTITIDNNPMITDISAFSKVSTVPYVFIKNNNNLENLLGLKGLRSVTNFLHIENNPKLKDLSGLENLTTIGRLEVINNNSLLNLIGLSGLTKTTQEYSVGIGGNKNLTSLTGLENLVEANGSVRIASNANLTDFCALKPLFSNGYSHTFFVEYNASNPSQNDIVTNCP